MKSAKSIKNLYSQYFEALSRIFVFPSTCASEKHLVSENRFEAVFKGAWVVLAGVECSPKIFEIFGERHSRQDKVKSAV